MPVLACGTIRTVRARRDQDNERRARGDGDVTVPNDVPVDPAARLYPPTATAVTPWSASAACAAARRASGTRNGEQLT